MAHDAKDIPAASRRVAIVGPDAWSMIHLREGLIRSLVARRHRVVCVCPPPSGDQAEALAKLGAEHAAWSPREAAIDVLAHRRSIDDLTRVLAECRPYAVLGYGLMPMLFAAIAARRAGAERIVPLVTGLGGLPEQSGAIGWSMKWLARSAFRAADAVVFHSASDATRLAGLRLLRTDRPVEIVPGGGVDLARFQAAPLPPLDHGLVFAMVARHERAKGVLEFCEMARHVKARTEAVRFVLAGPPGNPPDGLSVAQVAAAAAGAVELAGEVEDVRPILATAHVVVLPSHVEGMPRTVLEALATGRPVIVSDIPGARETVDERVNGVLVPAGDVAALVAAVQSFLKRPDLIPSMARASRLKAERRFDAAAVNTTLHRILLMPASEGRHA